VLDRLPFREIWAVDFEFVADPGQRPVPVCMVARELRSGRQLRIWQDDLPQRPPFDIGPNSLFVAYMAAAELGCFAELGWTMPDRVLDLYVEFRAITNGRETPHGRGLLGALSFHGIPGITADQKAAGRQLVMRGGPWTSAERAEILDYCQTDVDPLGPLLERMLPVITNHLSGLAHALLRGRYMAAVANMEHTGVPIDTATFNRLRSGWEDIKVDLIEAVDKDYGIYEGTTFKSERFLAWLRGAGIAWPSTATGRPKLDDDTFRDMSKLHPVIAPLRELRHAVNDLRPAQLAVGSDGRNRAPLFPFGARTGRNTPSANRFVFGLSVWIRGLIQPEEGRALAYIDWSAQEVAIAAALSGDEALLEAVQSGDPYLSFAKRAGLAPADATKATHSQIRDHCKACVLGSNYGMGSASLAYRIGVSETRATHLLDALRRVFPTFWQWSEDTIDRAVLSGTIRSVFGWPCHVGVDFRPTALRNYPMQANGAEMLRLACILATESGVDVCAPVHDALMIDANEQGLDYAVERTREAMREASSTVLGGIEIGTDVSVVRHPDRYSDPRGRVMWDRVTELLERDNEALWGARTEAAYAKQLEGVELDDMDREAVNRRVSEDWF
jgi:DNA polymerase-1